MNPLYDNAADVRQWRENRGVRLGASDAGAIMGLSPHKTALDVYVEKVRCIEGDTPDDPAALANFDITDPRTGGHLYEPLIARAYELREGVTLIDPGAAVHPEFDFIAATADRAHSDCRSLVELKKVGWRSTKYWGEPGTDNLPDHILIQAQHQMMVYGIKENRVVALIGEDDLRVYPLQYNVTLVDLITNAMCDFWGRVQRREPPDPDWTHPATADVVARLHKPYAGICIELDQDALDEIRGMEDAKQKKAAADDDVSMFKARLIHRMGDAGKATVGPYELTRKEITRKAYTVKEATYTDFRCKMRKEAEARK